MQRTVFELEEQTVKLSHQKLAADGEGYKDILNSYRDTYTREKERADKLAADLKDTEAELTHYEKAYEKADADLAAANERAERIKSERDMHYTRLASVLFSEQFGNVTNREVRAWMKDYVNERERAERIRAETIEECAQTCEHMSGPIEAYNRGYVHYLKCASSIRALTGESNHG